MTDTETDVITDEIDDDANAGTGSPLMFNGEELADPVNLDAADDGPDPVETAEREMWAMAGLDLNVFESLGSDSRKMFYGQEMAKLRHGQAPDKTTESVSSSGQPTKPDDLPVLKTPTFDADAIVKKFEEAQDENDSAAAASVFGEVLRIIGDQQKYSSDLTKIIMTALERQDGVLAGVTSEVGHLTRPAQLKRALPSVATIATEDDFPEADKLLVSGEAKTPADALVLAAGRRMNTKGVPNPGADSAAAREAARRKAMASRASGHRTASAKTGQQPGFMPVDSMNSPEGRRLLKDLEAQAGMSP